MVLDFQSIIRGTQSLIVRNANTILSGIAAAGVLSTSILAVKGTVNAIKTLRDEYPDEYENGTLEPKQVVEVVWKDYIPAVTSGIATVGAIILADRIGSRRAAALAAAYTITDNAFQQYRDKVISKFGKNQEEVVRAEVAKDRVNKSTEVIIASGGDVVCFDSFTGRTFMSNVETLRRVENQINHMIVNDLYASLSDYYNLLGLRPTAYSDEVGWNTDKLLVLRLSAILDDNDRPCINVDFSVTPVKYFNRLG